MPKHIKKTNLKLLFASSEAWPLAKTGGLGDVANALPNALTEHGSDVRVMLPAYREVLEKVEDIEILGWVKTKAHGDLRILQAYHPAFKMLLWLVDAAGLFDRQGNPYQQENGQEWPDNAKRFTAFSEAVALMALDALNLDWRADVVHANDWQTGLVAAFLEKDPNPPKRIFTIHNIAYDCLVDYPTFQQLKLPAHWWSIEHGEFYGHFSLLKAGLVSTDAITTVSPTYAKEIRTSEFGYGLSGVLEANKHKLFGILNGIDSSTWDPATDKELATNYVFGSELMSSKRANRKALLQAIEAPPSAQKSKAPLIGFIGRLVHQKGVDLLLELIPELIESTSAYFVLAGTGEKELEAKLMALQKEYPKRVFAFIGYSEKIAHLLEAACDIFVMPSRYEPCGLNQLYSLRYGTPPVVHKTGGLADTVIDANEENLSNGTANGFSFDSADVSSLRDALLRALRMKRVRKEHWHQILEAGMQRDSSWESSANAYLRLYNQ